jgi:hypothetical protein
MRTRTALCASTPDLGLHTVKAHDEAALARVKVSGSLEWRQA